MSRVRKLTDIEIDEVSVVDRPSNQHGLIAFSKALGAGSTPEEGTMPPDADVIYDVDGDEVDPGLLEHGDVVYDGEGNEYVFVEEDAEQRQPEPVGKAVNPLKAARAGFRNPNSVAPGIVGDKAMLAGQHVGRNKKAYGTAAALTGAGALGGTAYGLSKSDTKSAGDTVLESLSKAVTDADRDEIIAKALNEVEVYKAQADQMAEALAQEQDIRLTEAYISKASEYNLPVSPSVLGPILKSIAEALTDEELDVLDALFEAIGDALYEEVGYVGDTDNTSVVDMVNGYADELVGKSDMSHAEAAVAMYSAHPEAYEAYLAENGR
jgi:hypothetical protein